MVASNIAGQNVEKVDARLDDRAAIVTDQVVVAMRVLHEVEDGRAGHELNRADDAELREPFERPIDGGLVEDGVIAADDLDDVGRREVMVAGGKHGFHDQPPGTCDPTAALAESFEDALGLEVSHTSEVR
ncbi:MAG: hypothetical protein WKF64_02310 [Ilumatobacteraceae bacterium]